VRKLFFIGVLLLLFMLTACNTPQSDIMPLRVQGLVEGENTKFYYTGQEWFAGQQVNDTFLFYRVNQQQALLLKIFPVTYPILKWAGVYVFNVENVTYLRLGIINNQTTFYRINRTLEEISPEQSTLLQDTIQQKIRQEYTGVGFLNRDDTFRTARIDKTLEEVYIGLNDTHSPHWYMVSRIKWESATNEAYAEIVMEHKNWSNWTTRKMYLYITKEENRLLYTRDSWQAYGDFLHADNWYFIETVSGAPFWDQKVYLLNKTHMIPVKYFRPSLFGDIYISSATSSTHAYVRRHKELFVLIGDEAHTVLFPDKYTYMDMYSGDEVYAVVEGKTGYTAYVLP
jgi:hypothetical protein